MMRGILLYILYCIVLYILYFSGECTVSVYKLYILRSIFSFVYDRVRNFFILCFKKKHVSKKCTFDHSIETHIKLLTYIYYLETCT